MKLISLVLTCAAIALLGIACTETATPTNTSTATKTASPAAATSPAPVDATARAQTNFTKNCEACHGPSGEGGTVTVEGKRLRVPSLKAAHAVKHTDDELLKIVTSGEEEMPAFKDKLSAEEIAELVAFVRKNFQGK
ncbi:MAG TPA: cytochrome c [Pyrinomonadaceae bacterium]|nr:cytochrome c [Pyrinomonadaceae bacterium]